jgi:Heterokaryon incompatibility protein (HET)
MENAVMLITQWLRDCRKNHKSRTRVESSIKSPTRLVELGTGELRPRIITTSGKPQIPSEYVYLSYNWGTSAPLTTKKENYEEFQQEIDLSRLPRLHRDFFDLCFALGYRYVLLDALCIIHDDEEDRNTETSRMGDYISSADLVIAATQKTTDEPLFALREKAAETILSYTAYLEDKPDKEFDLYIRKPLSVPAEAVQENIVDRAWRTQEAFLASRLVIIESNQISWTCNTVQQSEGSNSILSPTLDNFPSLESWLDNHKSTVAPDKILQTIYLRWYSIIHTISQGRLRDEENDRFPALAGFASKFKELMNRWDCEYLAGIWTKDLTHGLLWIDDKSHFSYSIPDETKTDFCPSWSWASNRGPISYCFAAGLKIPHSTDDNAEFVLIERHAGQNALMHPLGAYLIVSAMSMPASMTQITAQYQYFFDSNSQSELCMMDPADILGRCRLVLLAPWTCQLGSSHHIARWVGLVLEELGEKKFKRKGVFVGPDTDWALDHWERMEMTLV